MISWRRHYVKLNYDDDDDDDEYEISWIFYQLIFISFSKNDIQYDDDNDNENDS